MLGGLESCYRVRAKLAGEKLEPISLKIDGIPGNGLGAYNSHNIAIHVNGGAQDGVGKTSLGGDIYVLKGKGKDGRFYNGSVGKGFGYGAQKGALYVQGNADARAGIRLSGADMIIGGRITRPIPKQEYGNIGGRANIKGFAFEYMTNGRGLVLGDPGPWMCAGMTGGVIYVRHQPEMGLTKEALTRRIAKGANVTLQAVSSTGVADITELLLHYAHVLRLSNQEDEAQYVTDLLLDISGNFLEVIPTKEQADPAVSTE
ncbi:hypothetical protein ACFPT3_14175 [Ectobacillus antri]|uniref:GltB/FmdC/FwdC-like GXGXG domain-containing protein n=1 Tax=Ectobacillus antri TaxID=2486280 RepID=UPI0036162422